MTTAAAGIGSELQPVAERVVPHPEGGVVPDVSGLGHNTVATLGR